MVKVLVVEDMTAIRKGIVKLLNAHEVMFEEIYEACDGEEAVEIIEEYKPHILITDIRLPKASGLDVIKKAVEINPNIQTIIISGYAEFEFAEKAIRYGVKGYILKPIKEVELFPLIQKCISELEDYLVVKRIKYDYNHLLEQQKHSHLEKNLNLYFSEQYKRDNENIDKLLSEIGFSSKDYIRLGIIHIHKANISNLNLDTYQIRQIIKKAAEDKKTTFIKFIFPNLAKRRQVFVLLGFENPDKLLFESEVYFQELCSSLLKENNIDVSIAISSIKKELSLKPLTEANKALQNRLIMRSQRIYRFDEKSSNNREGQSLENNLRLMSKSIKNNEIKFTKELLKIILEQEENKRFSEFYYIWYRICSMLISSLNINIDDVNDLKLFNQSFIDTFDSVHQMYEFLSEVIDRYSDVKVLRLDEDKVVEYVNKIINKNYCENISISSLASELYISTSHLSNIYKKYTKTTLSDKIRKLRLNKACQLLKDTSMSISEIATSVGYNDVQYFYRIFKKNHDITPLGYRKKFQS